MADLVEFDQRLAARRGAYDRWVQRLRRRPPDAEMAAWLDCDRKYLMQAALMRSQVPLSDLIAYAFLEAPGRSCKRARWRNGPWRFSRYQLVVFLLTRDGVRQVTVGLDFERGSFHDQQRSNYRFDAVAAVRVEEADDGRRTFELALVNGESVRIDMIEADQGSTGPDSDSTSGAGSGAGSAGAGDDLGIVSAVTLDAAGLANTLHVLEGVAAEGKEWIGQERQRGAGRMSVLVGAAPGRAD